MAPTTGFACRSSFMRPRFFRPSSRNSQAVSHGHARYPSVINSYLLNDVSLKLLGQASISRRQSPVDQEYS
jgi:hypothetical protein